MSSPTTIEGRAREEKRSASSASFETRHPEDGSATFTTQEEAALVRKGSFTLTSIFTKHIEAHILQVDLHLLPGLTLLYLLSFLDRSNGNPRDLHKDRGLRV
jgi:hypothetical protein